MTETDAPAGRYSPPAGLADIEVAAVCQADITLTVLEPKVSGTSSNSPSGLDWTGVTGVLVVLSGGGRNFSATTGSTGEVSFAAVPCGNYRVELTQREFKIASEGPNVIKVNSSKNGRDTEIKIQRQLLTVEMFRLPTHYWESVRLNTGKQANPDINDDPYGHHWLKIYGSEAMARAENPSESYGWWPTAGAGFPDLLTGVPGELNGATNYGGSATRDPYHTKYKRGDASLEDVFFPFVTNGKTAAQYKADIKSKAQGFSGSVSNQWSWRSDGGGWHCKTFQTYIMRETRLWKRLGIGVGAFGWSTGT
jgi:hypothetical protein